jgi:hypothetical protein
VEKNRSKPFASCTLDGLIGPFLIINAKRDPVAIPEVKLRQIAVQMFLGTVLINALHAALEDRIVTRCRFAATVDDVDTVFMANITVLAQKMCHDKLTDLITGCVERARLRRLFESISALARWVFRIEFQLFAYEGGPPVHILIPPEI